ncbi:acyl carrier protein [Catellatospora tritici]|uniref:acyl carrier protein n=1 Tax=Catellatospora tritici TaxID=2851566 RepID=UPI001C2D098E|nr:acyl carrier protein [Catellatospora tritici]MBV1851194.1 acyl carrier protein [Catellatospora tritici]
MTNEIRQFVLDSLSEMKYDVTDIDDDTTLGPAGADLESLALAELTVRVEERYGVRFDDDEAEALATSTVGELCAAVAARLETATA